MVYERFDRRGSRAGSLCSAPRVVADAACAPSGQSPRDREIIIIIAGRRAAGCCPPAMLVALLAAAWVPLATAHAMGATPALEHLATGVAHLTSGRLLRAAVWMRRSLEADTSDNPEALGAMNAVGEELMEQGLLGAAEACWRCSLEVDAFQVGVGERLAFTLRLNGRLHEAANALRETLDMPLLDDEEEKCWLWLDLGAMLEDIAPVPGAGPEVILGGHARPVNTVDVGGEELTAEACYRHAIALAPSVGEAHKRLADVLVLTEDAHAAHPSYKRAATLNPTDICCATHCHYRAATSAHRQALAAIPFDAASGRVHLEELQHALPPVASAEAGLSAEAESWAISAAAHFERHGVIVLPGMLDEEQLATLSDAVLPPDAGTGDADVGEDDHDDFTAETREADCRTHRALALAGEPAVVETLSVVTAALWPLLARALQVDTRTADQPIPLIGAGHMTVSPGAKAQLLHKDVHGHDRFDLAAAGEADTPGSGGGPRAVSLQLQLTDTLRHGDPDASLGSLEVLPGSHRPDAAMGSEEAIRAALEGDEPSIVPVDVPAGSVTLYSSRLWHRGGANGHTDRKRAFAFLTVGEPEVPAPPGLIHTMTSDDVGRWVARPEGLLEVERAEPR